MELPSRTPTKRWLLLGIAAFGITVVCADQAQAQVDVLVSPMIGYDFGGDAGCPRLSDCQDKRINTSVSAGAVGNLFGLEEEMAYAPDFFGHAPGISSSVFTLMINALLIPKMGPLRPYAFTGMGLIRTHIQLTTSEIFATTDSDFGWDLGGGLIGFIGKHVGLRGDLRYFRSAQDTAVLGFTLPDSKLDYGRASAGVVLKF